MNLHQALQFCPQRIEKQDLQLKLDTALRLASMVLLPATDGSVRLNYCQAALILLQEEVPYEALRVEELNHFKAIVRSAMEGYRSKTTRPKLETDLLIHLMRTPT